MKLARVTVEITRFSKTRNLSARVVETDARGAVRGANLLRGRRIRKIETAKARVLGELAAKAETVSFDVRAAPDAPPPYRPVTRRTIAEALE